MTKSTIVQILVPKPELRPRIYAYSIADTLIPPYITKAQALKERRRLAHILSLAEIPPTGAPKHHPLF